MTAIVEVEGLARKFGKTEALCGVDLEVHEGRVVALLGPNGAGKTTLVRILSTLLHPTAGKARIAGYDVVKQATAVRRLIGLAGQNAAVDETLTGRENLEMVGRLSRLSKKEAAERAADTLERLSLADAGDRPLKGYSGGMRRRLDLGAGFVARPRVLLLDEPTTGLDPASRLELWSFLRDLVREGASVLLTTQYLEEADQLASDIVVIDHGKIIAHGTPVELKDRLGGDVIDVSFDDSVDLEAVAKTLADVGTEAPTVDRSVRRVTIPVANGSDGLVAVVRALDGNGVRIEDLVLRRPSLDDVFLALTGHTTSPEGSITDEAVRTREESTR